MTWFIESPWPSLAIGFALEVILAIALVRTGRTAIIAAMVVVLAATIGLLALERVVVTEREEVEDTLDAVAAALESNDVPAVLAAFSPNCPRLGEVKSALSRFTVREARIGGDLEVRINRLTSPPSAATYFTGRIDGKDSRGEFPYEHMIRKFKVTLERRGDKWLIADYSDADSRAR
jgi:hypothetical protein